MQGVFSERPSDAHLPRRQSVLRRLEWYRSPTDVDPIDADADDVAGLARMVVSALQDVGVAWLQLDRLLDNGELLELAQALGSPQVHRDERLQPWVEDDVVLNVRADQPETHDREWELLFAENYVMLHSELAWRDIDAGLLRYLVFQCVTAPPVDGGGQTLLVPMKALRQGITDRQASILRTTRHAAFTNPRPFLFELDGRDVFAFKDTEGEPIPWSYEGSDPSVTAEEVDASLRTLFRAAYDPSQVRGVHWRPLGLVAFDNTRFLHGRTVAPTPAGRSPRHLREIRVFE